MTELNQAEAEALSDVLSPQSPGAVFWTQMKKSPLAIAGGVLLTFFYLLALFAPFIAPYPQEEMDRQNYFHPPQTLHWISPGTGISTEAVRATPRLAGRSGDFSNTREDRLAKCRCGCSCGATPITCSA